MLDNKWFFHLHFSQLGFPVPGLRRLSAGVRHQHRGQAARHRDGSRSLLELDADQSQVIKPVGGIMGHGVMILSELQYGSGTVGAMTNGGEVLAFDDIAGKLDTPPDVHYRMRNYD